MLHDKHRGIYGKFNVTRTDGSSGSGGRHDGCPYWVLDVAHDPFAIPALKAYALACAGSHPLLAQDIERALADSDPAKAISEAISKG